MNRRPLLALAALATTVALFGGVKRSGIGREECFGELLEFTTTKNVHVQLG